MTESALQHKMDVWNRTVGEHGEVDFRSHPTGPMKRYNVMGPAYIMNGHTVVVKLEGRAGSVAISACKRVKNSPGIL
jgi:hypothetical protein